MDIREASHPHEFKSYSTDRMRQEFLIQEMFELDAKVDFNFCAKMLSSQKIKV